MAASQVSLLRGPLDLAAEPLVGCCGSCDHCVWHRDGGLHGQGRSLVEQHRAAHPGDLRAWDNRAYRAALSELSAMARIEGGAAALGPAFVRRGPVFATVTAEDDALKQGLTLTRGTGLVAVGALAWQALLVGFAGLPAAVAWRHLFDQGMPDFTRPLGRGGAATGAVAQARAAIGPGARVSRIVQAAQGRTTRQGAPPQLPAVRPLDGTSRNGEALLVAIRHHGDRGAQCAEGLEKQAHRFLSWLSRIEDDLPCGRIDKTNRQLGGQCTPGRLVAPAAWETCT